MSKSNKVCVVIPVYKEILNEFEKVSLIQVSKVLKDYALILVAPEHLEIDKYLDINNELRIERFEDSYFESIVGYSELCLSQKFYERFIIYEYLLIYQLDAFVFSDRLMEFVEMGFDYIGAPLAGGRWKRYHVGNGGFSLRNIRKTIELLNYKEKILEECTDRYYFEHQEDNFFAYCGVIGKYNFKVPSPYVAVKFSAQDDCYGGMRRIKKYGLPFGTHHFPEWNYGFWKPFIEKYGYKLPTLKIEYYVDRKSKNKTKDPYNLFFHELMRADDELKKNVLRKIIINESNPCALYGAGYWGRLLYKNIYACGVQVRYIFDQNCNKTIFDRKVDTPNEDRIRDFVENEQGYIIITAEKYDEEISNYLKQIGLKEKINFIKFQTMCENIQGIVDEYYKYNEIYGESE